MWVGNFRARSARVVACKESGGGEGEERERGSLADRVEKQIKIIDGQEGTVVQIRKSPFRPSGNKLPQTR